MKRSPLASDLAIPIVDLPPNSSLNQQIALVIQQLTDLFKTSKEILESTKSIDSNTDATVNRLDLALIELGTANAELAAITAGVGLLDATTASILVGVGVIEGTLVIIPPLLTAMAGNLNLVKENLEAFRSENKNGLTNIDSTLRSTRLDLNTFRVENKQQMQQLIGLQIDSTLLFATLERLISLQIDQPRLFTELTRLQSSLVSIASYNSQMLELMRDRDRVFLVRVVVPALAKVRQDSRVQVSSPQDVEQVGAHYEEVVTTGITVKTRKKPDKHGLFPPI